MEDIEIGACGPVGGRLSRESFRSLLWFAAGGAGFVIFLAWFSRIQREASLAQAAPLAVAVLASAGLMAWGVVAMIRRGDDWALAQAGTLGVVILFDIYEKAPAGSPWRVAAAILPLIPAALFVWSNVRMIRRADELQRRIVYEALAFAYIVTLSAALLGAALQSAGLPRWNWIWIAGVLVFSWSLGLVIARRRYR
ncbi:MAG: hypothetical protein M3R62_02115 [Acidobacteriota bacterium]|nr:hypothetical protein [Acidobacteriota bacterium]MDQ2977987.1 hypothetical protein [Acidobacteriota bacterium]